MPQKCGSISYEKMINKSLKRFMHGKCILKANASKLVLTKTLVNVLTESDLSLDLFSRSQSDRASEPLDVSKQP